METKFDIENHDERGFNEEGIHRVTGTKYDMDGYDINGYGKHGFDRKGIHRVTGTKYDVDGYDQFGFNEVGVNRAGYIKGNGENGQKDKQKYDSYDYDIHKDGYDRYSAERVRKETRLKELQQQDEELDIQLEQTGQVVGNE